VKSIPDDNKINNAINSTINSTINKLSIINDRDIMEIYNYLSVNLD